MDVPIDYKTYFSDLLRNSNLIASQIRDDVEHLVDSKLLKEKPTDILFVERKGVNLFHHTFNKLKNAGFSVGRIRVFSVGKRSFLLVNPRFEILKDVIVCTDAINTGNEISTLLKILNIHDVSIKKIFCYYVNLNSLSKLITQKIIRDNQLVYVHKVSKDENYSNLAKKLNIYFQSKIEPMDVDHIYDLFKLTSSFKKISDFKDILNSGAYLFFRKNIKFEKDKLVPKNIIGFSLDYSTDNSWNDLSFCLPSKIIKGVKNFCDISFFEIRIKFELQDFQNFTVMLYSQIEDVDTLSLIKSECPIKSINGACLKDKISHNKGVSDREIASIVCTLCIENYISSLILDKFENKLVNEFERKNLQLVKKDRYNPISRIDNIESVGILF